MKIQHSHDWVLVSEETGVDSEGTPFTRYTYECSECGETYSNVFFG